jgi:phage shock protein C
MTCTSCQRDIADGSNFCYNCGAKQAINPPPPVNSYSAAQRRLVRSTNDRKIAGVCAGLADYFDFDPTIVRIIWVLVTFVPGPNIIAYLILWIALPEGVTRAYPYSATSSI